MRWTAAVAGAMSITIWFVVVTRMSAVISMPLHPGAEALDARIGILNEPLAEMIVVVPSTLKLPRSARAKPPSLISGRVKSPPPIFTPVGPTARP